jgi:hypothetical protein
VAVCGRLWPKTAAALARNGVSRTVVVMPGDAASGAPLTTQTGESPAHGADPVERAPALQLRLGFSTPDAPVELALHLVGLTVVVDLWQGRFDEAWSYLLSAGVAVRMEDGRGIVFPIGELAKLDNLPAQVRVTSRGPLEVLYGIATSGDGLPATVHIVDVDGPDGRPVSELWVSWYSHHGRHQQVLDDVAATALLASELPFVASEEAWERLESMAGFPLVVGRARLNHDGYLEISTSKPQLAESAPLPGLFRIDDTHFGMARAYAPDLYRLRGFVWDGPAPRRVRPTSVRSPGTLELSAHHRADLDELVSALDSWGARIICWERGLGRRIMALAALEVLDAWPALVVAAPWDVWVWRRHFDLAGRQLSLSAGRGDAHLVTYLDLARGAATEAFEALVLDDLSGPDAAAPSARAALAGLGAVADAYRIGVCSTWPQDPEEACELLDLLRPGEFHLRGMSLSQRYPLRPVPRAEEHASVYLSRRSAGDDDTDTRRFPRSEVRVVPPSTGQRQALEELASAGMDLRDLLGRTCEVLSAGTGGSVSPKVAAAVQIARDGVAAGRSVAVACASSRAATLIRAAAAPLAVRLVDGTDPNPPSAGEVCVVVRRRSAVSLAAFDWVVFCEWPWSTETIELSVGAAGGGPERVVVLHSPGTVDDRLAMYAARRGEYTGLSDCFSPPTDDELPYLLATRWC